MLLQPQKSVAARSVLLKIFFVHHIRFKAPFAAKNQNLPFLLFPLQVHFKRALDQQLAKKGLGKLRKHCAEFAHAVRLIKAISYVPKAGVSKAYVAVVDHIDKHVEAFVKVDPNYAPKVDSYLAYLETYYIGAYNNPNIPPRFPAQTWTKHEEILQEQPTTNNSCEGKQVY